MIPRARSALAGATLLAVLPAAATTPARPDLSGFWRLAAPQTALRTETGKMPPLGGWAEKAYLATAAWRAAGDLRWDATATRCKPPGEPRILLEGMPFEIVQQQTRIFFAYQWNGLDRFIDLGAPQRVLAPSYFGTSSGRWQGDALVVDDRGFNDKTSLDRDGMPHTDHLRLTERLRLGRGGDTLLMRITLADAGVFTAPWSTDLRFVRTGGPLAEDICEIREGRVLRAETGV